MNVGDQTQVLYKSSMCALNLRAHSPTLWKVSGLWDHRHGLFFLSKVDENTEVSMV